MSKILTFSPIQEHNPELPVDVPYTEFAPKEDKASLSISKEIMLNKLCSSLITKENRKRFRAFPESYCREYGLVLIQIHAVTDLDVMRLLKLGATIANLGLLTATYGMNVLELCSEQTGKSVDEIKEFIETL